MTVALITNSPKDVVTTYPSVPLSLLLPTGDIVMGAAPGWTSPNGTYSLVNVASFVIPSGQMAIGDPIYSFDGGGNVIETYTTVPIPLAQQAAARAALLISSGLVVLCTGNPSLDALYPVDQVTQNQITSIAEYVDITGTFPNKQTMLTWPDGELHSFTISQFVEFAEAVADFVAAVEIAANTMAQGGTPMWPTNQATIA